MGEMHGRGKGGSEDRYKRVGEGGSKNGYKRMEIGHTNINIPAIPPRLPREEGLSRLLLRSSPSSRPEISTGMPYRVKRRWGKREI